MNPDNVVPIAATGALLLVILLAVIARLKHIKEENRPEAPPTPKSSSSTILPPATVQPARRGVLAVVGMAAALALASSGVLGYFVWDLRKDLDAAGDELNQQLEAAEARIAASTAAALTKLSEVQQVRNDLDDLEEVLFGFAGPSIADRDVIGDLRREIDGVRGCVNRLVSDLIFDSVFLSRCF